MNNSGKADGVQVSADAGNSQVLDARDAMAAAEAAVASAMNAANSATQQGMDAARDAVARSTHLLAKLTDANPPETGADEPGDEGSGDTGQGATESATSSTAAADRAVIAAVQRATETVTSRLVEQQQILDATQASMLAALTATATASGQAPAEDE